MDAEKLAFAMFMRRCELDELEPVLAEMAWTTDPGVRDFWLAEAEFVLTLVAA